MHYTYAAVLMKHFTVVYVEPLDYSSLSGRGQLLTEILGGAD